MRSMASSLRPAFRKVSASRLRGMVQGMRASFTSFTLGLALAVMLLYLILVAQFQSFLDPFIILLAVPPGLTGVMLTLWLTDTTLNVMSLMGVVMLVGIAVSNSILIVEFTRHLRSEGMEVREAVATGLPRPVTPRTDDVARDHHRPASHGVETRRRQRVLCSLGAGDSGRSSVSVALTVFLVPAAYVLVYDRSH